MDQQSRAVEEEVASNMPNDEKKIVSKEAKLHVAIPAPSGSLDFKLSLSMNLASTQGPQDSKQNQNQSTNRDAQDASPLMNLAPTQGPQGSKQTQIQRTGQDAQDASPLMNLAPTQGPQGSKQTQIQSAGQNAQDVSPLMNLAPTQGPQGGKQTQIQSTGQDAQDASQNVKRKPIENSLIGHRIYKMYAGEYCEGKITGYDPARKLFEILYLDNGIEEMDLDELQLWIAADEHEDQTDIRRLIQEAIAQDSESPSKKAKKSLNKPRTTYRSLNLEIPHLENDEIPNLYGDSPK